jgi:coenzyme PQQ precursor peptide PqqA
LQSGLGQSILVILVIEKALGRTKMAWTTPTLVEICIGLEINGYLPAEF